MPLWNEAGITRAILDSYRDKLAAAVDSDVVIVGAGPAGLTAAHVLASAGRRVTVIEKRLAPGGGVWGGGMGMNQIVLQEEALAVAEGAGIRMRSCTGGLFVTDAAELACALCLRALQAGATLLNLLTLEDLCVHNGRVDGAVVNRTTLAGTLPVDPIVFSAGAVIDASGHDAVAVEKLRRRGLLKAELSEAGFGEGPMDAEAGERFVVERVAEVYPGLWVAGMAVCTTFRGPRMGPIFGGMLLSGKRVAEEILRRNA